MKEFKQEFDRVWQRIFVDRLPTCFARYADGEYALIKGQSVGEGTQAFQVDGWKAPEELTQLGTDLISSLYHTEEGYIYALTSPTQNPAVHKDYMTMVKQVPEWITYSDLWINSNYKFFNTKIRMIQEPVFFIASDDAEKHVDLRPFQTLDFLGIPKNCVRWWEEQGVEFLEELLTRAKPYSNTLFLISAGPVSEVLIHHLYHQNPTNRYIDVGSAVDEFVHGRKTRPYMMPETPYYNSTPTWD